jgi:hypothetical protein
VGVAGADFSDVKMTGARAAVDWSSAKVQPAELPEPFAPPRWLPFVFLGIIALFVFLKMRSAKNRDK